MRRAFGVVELLVVIVVLIILYFACFHNPGVQTNPLVNDVNEVKTKQQMVDDKLNEIQQTKMLKEKMDRNLNDEY